MPKKKTKKLPLRASYTREEYLQILLKYSLRAVTGQGSGVDEFFTQQSNKLKQELKELRKSK